ncbi:hypothetical protein [Fodinibius halophilus]|uniref:DUF4402 domain-containing protein n=1 Tax=Fodinibius halophilus TaxID=1736908 RepID=A0A6M1T580_9BACT|nr:hypothetical protein [Fodinibius halophilus]NGP87833.1 hypothetical protein [Fodinibius halophilus]
MFKRLFILSLFLAATVSISFGQAAKATMRVSVNVVKGNSIETVNKEKVTLSERYGSEVGSLKLRGLDKDKALIETSEVITLENSKGNKISMDIIQNIKQSGSNTSQLSLLGFSRGELESGMYKGEISTTIEYL